MLVRRLQTFGASAPGALPPPPPNPSLFRHALSQERKAHAFLFQPLAHSLSKTPGMTPGAFYISRSFSLFRALCTRAKRIPNHFRALRALCLPPAFWRACLPGMPARRGGASRAFSDCQPSTVDHEPPKSFAIRTCRRSPCFSRNQPQALARKSFTIRTYRRRFCNSFRIRTYQENWGRVPP